MKIINYGKKDYYDYIPGIYGIDTDVVYDRHNFHVFRKGDAGEQFFINECLYLYDRDKQNIGELTVIDGKMQRVSRQGGVKYYFVIEAGFEHYLFSVERYIDDDGSLVMNPAFVKKIECEKKSKYPLSIIPVEYRGWWNELPSIRSWDIDKEIVNPILNDTWVPSLLKPEDIYNDIYNYLINIREPKIVDNRTDIQKLESKGFDKTTSFRNPINPKKKR